MTNTPEFLEGQVQTLSGELTDAYRTIERLERERTDLEQQVHVLSASESITLVNLTARYEALLESNVERVKELRLANEDAETANLALDKAMQANADLEAKVKRQEAALFDANASLHELKALTLIGPLTAEEWLEFRLRTDEDEDHELLRCCANTSGIRDAIFILMRSNAEDAVLGRARFSAAWEAFNDHGYEDWSDRARELMDRLHAYYGCHGCTEHS